MWSGFCQPCVDYSYATPLWLTSVFYLAKFDYFKSVKFGSICQARGYERFVEYQIYYGCS